MKCELCHEREAEVAIKRIVDGEERELFVCKRCAMPPRRLTTSMKNTKDGGAIFEISGPIPVDGVMLPRELKDLLEKFFGDIGEDDGHPPRDPDEDLEQAADEAIADIFDEPRKNLRAHDEDAEDDQAAENPERELLDEPPEILDDDADNDDDEEKRFHVSKADEVESEEKDYRRHMAEHPCPNCGLTLDGFRRAEKFGCGFCYVHFRPDWEDLMEQWHPGVVHIGKKPGDKYDSPEHEELLPDAQMSAAARDIVISSRLRLSRNLCNTKFPHACTTKDLFKCREKLSAALTKAYPQFQICNTEDVPPLLLESLSEENVISRDLASRRLGAAFARSHSISAMINEEDHLRLQILSTGIDFDRMWKNLSTLDDMIARQVNFLYDPPNGYLSACPSNAGTGLRASVMLHLAGLDAAGRLNQTLDAVDRLHYNVRGIAGEGTDGGDTGAIYQISTQGTLGKTEEEILGEFRQLVLELIRVEDEARRWLWADDPDTLEDSVARALAGLASARLISADEAIERLSFVRLGATFGMIKPTRFAREIDDLMLAVRPAHLRLMLGAKDADFADDFERAKFLREKFKKIKFLEKQDLI